MVWPWSLQGDQNWEVWSTQGVTTHPCGCYTYTKRVHAATLYILQAQRGSYEGILRPKYMLCRYTDPWGPLTCLATVGSKKKRYGELQGAGTRVACSCHSIAEPTVLKVRSIVDFPKIRGLLGVLTIIQSK